MRDSKRSGEEENENATTNGFIRVDPFSILQMN